MTNHPFAAEWHETTKVFGIPRELPAHEFYETEEELNAQVKRLKEKGITEVTLYRRVNGQLEKFLSHENK